MRLLLFALALPIVAISIRAEDKTVSSTELGFQVNYPDTWKWSDAVAANSTPRVESKIAPGATASAVINFSRHELTKAGENLYSFVDDAKNDMKRSLTNFLLVNEADMKIGDVPAYRVTFLYNSARDNLRCKCEITVLVLGKRAYLIRAGALNKDYESYVDSIDAIVKSFKVVPTK